MKTIRTQWSTMLLAVLLFSAGGAVQAQYVKLYSFAGGTNSGSTPYGSLTLSGSTLYGMAYGGGASNNGVVFKINTDGSSYTNLHSLKANAPLYEGMRPFGSLTLSGSTLYGMTSSGGLALGVVFRVNTDGSGYTNLHNFVNNGIGGYGPLGSLTLSGSTLYGMTQNGGGSNRGVIFQMNTDGTGYTVLHTFSTSSDDGQNPIGSLTLSGSKLYGMTEFGGVSNAGVVFQVNTDGTGYTNLHEFVHTDGDNPQGDLTLSGSKLYGMTQYGGVSNVGVVFQINTDGTGYTNLHEFVGTDGSRPGGSLTLSGSTLYGTTQYGGLGALGVVFQMNTDGTGYTTLYDIELVGDGTYPRASLTLSGSTLYGMSPTGGSNGLGVVFALTPPVMVTGAANPTNSGSVSGGGSYFATSNAVLTATASNGWAFLNWNDGATNNPYSITVPPSNITYTANFALIATVTADVNTNIGGSVTGGGTYASGANVQLAAIASNGWAFLNWNNGATNNPYSITVPPSNITYTANFALTATITADVNTNIGGSVTGGGSYFVGSNAVLTATPSSGWQFLNWNDGDTNNPRSIVVVSNITYTATFTNAEVSVLLQQGDGGIAGVWNLDRNYQPATWTHITGAMGNHWRIQAMTPSSVLLQQGTGGVTGLWDLDASSTPTNWWQVYGPLSGWIMRDYDAGRILLQEGDGGRVGIWTLSSSNTVTSWHEIYPPMAGLIARSLSKNRLLVQFTAGVPYGFWTLNTNNDVTAWTELHSGLSAGWILRSMTPTHILLQQGDGGTAGVWELNTNGIPVAWHQITGPLSGWILRGLVKAPPAGPWDISVTLNILNSGGSPAPSISPTGPTVQVADGSNQTFSITIPPGYHLVSTVIDGTPTPLSFSISGAFRVYTYTFTAVHTNHTIVVNTDTLGGA